MRILTLYMEQGCMYNNRMDGLKIVESIVVPLRENLFLPSSLRKCVLLWDFCRKQTTIITLIVIS